MVQQDKTPRPNMLWNRDPKKNTVDCLEAMIPTPSSQSEKCARPDESSRIDCNRDHSHYAGNSCPLPVMHAVMERCNGCDTLVLIIWIWFQFIWINVSAQLAFIRISNITFLRLDATDTILFILYRRVATFQGQLLFKSSVYFFQLFLSYRDMDVCVWNYWWILDSKYDRHMILITVYIDIYIYGETLFEWLLFKSGI